MRLMLICRPMRIIERRVGTITESFGCYGANSITTTTVSYLKCGDGHYLVPIFSCHISYIIQFFPIDFFVGM